MSNFDFDGHFSNLDRRVSRHMWIASIIRLVWAVGCIGILGGFLWLIGYLAGAW